MWLIKLQAKSLQLDEHLGEALLWFECILQKLTGYKLNHKILSKWELEGLPLGGS